MSNLTMIRTEPSRRISGGFRRAFSRCRKGYIRYSIQYTTTPVTDTYSQMGSVQRAMAR